MTRPIGILWIVLLTATLLAGCGSPSEHSAVGSGDAVPLSQEVTVHQTWQAGTWVNTGRMVATLGPAGRPAQQTEARYHGVGWTVGERTRVYYAGAEEPDAVLAGSRREQRTREGWLSTDSTRHAYDAAGQRIQTDVLAWMWPEERWVPARRIVYDYDAEGLERTRLTLRPYYGPDGEQVALAHASDLGWHHQELVTFTYTVAGHCSTRVAARWQEGQWLPRERSLYTWDSGRQATEAVAQWRDGRWQPELEHSFAYDAEGRLRQTLTSASAELGGEPITRTVVTYPGPF